MIGKTLGHYQVLEKLGEGGMGDVYRGRDTRLGRSVAIKVLSVSVAGDPDARRRLEREARTIAALNHAHICVLHDVGHHEGIDFLVMELAEGETLRARLTRGPLPVSQALQYAIEISGALDKAHQHGIVHRDLKPGNIMLTRAGAKLLDFGIAKLVRPASEDPVDVSTRETLTSPGTIVGTVPYMSPEQLQQRPIDARTDIFAFGAVLYEMLTARRAFAGDNTAAIIGAVLEREPPPIDATGAEAVSPALARVIRKCLAKDPEARWQSCRDLRDELAWIKDGGASGAVAAPAAVRRGGVAAWSGWIAAGVLGVIATAAVAIWTSGPSSPPAESIAVDLAAPAGVTQARQPKVSPDGRHVAFLGRQGSAETRIWVRSLDSSDAAPLEGTQNASGIFWSPDSEHIGFEGDNRIRRVSRRGGAVQQISEAPPGGILGGAWGADNIIVFGTRGGIQRVSASGGTPEPATALDTSRQENSHRWPVFLPDGKRFLFVARSGRVDNNSFYLGHVDGSPSRRLFPTQSNAQSNAVYSQTGHLLFMRDGALVALPVDPSTLERRGDPVIIVDRVSTDVNALLVPFSISETGTLLYQPGGRDGQELLWFDRQGKPAGSVGVANATTFMLSPDGAELAISRPEPGGGVRSIWIVEVATGAERRLTLPSDNSWIPVWAPDGRRIAYSSYRQAMSDLYVRDTAGGASDELLVQSNRHKFAHDWSRDGRHIVYMEGRDLWIVPLAGDRKPFVLFNSAAFESFPRFSPDGKWIAYGSDESGADEVWVAAFPPTGARWQVTRGGGGEPRWRGDGQELFYMAPGPKLMSVPVAATDAFRAGSPTELFPIRLANAGAGHNYEVTADGQRVLAGVVRDAAPSPFQMVLNWPARLKGSTP